MMDEHFEHFKQYDKLVMRALDSAFGKLQKTLPKNNPTYKEGYIDGFGYAQQIINTALDKIVGIDIDHKQALDEDYERSMTLVLDELKRLYSEYGCLLGAYDIMKEFEYTHMRLNMHRKEKIAKAWIVVGTDDALRKFMEWMDEVSE